MAAFVKGGHAGGLNSSRASTLTRADVGKHAQRGGIQPLAASGCCCCCCCTQQVNRQIDR